MYKRQGEYEGDAASLQTAMGDDTAVSTVVLDAENGATLSKDVEKAYLDVLKQGTESYHCLLYTSYWQWRKE